jgi:hypothetical protein
MVVQAHGFPPWRITTHKEGREEVMSSRATVIEISDYLPARSKSSGEKNRGGSLSTSDTVACQCYSVAATCLLELLARSERK